jgi:site-specific DNA-cytosine methylase
VPEGESNTASGNRVDSCNKKFQEIAGGDNSRQSLKRLHRRRYSPAAAYGNNEVHLHPTEKRRLTVRETMRIQTVPDEYAFHLDISVLNDLRNRAWGPEPRFL